MDEYQSVDLEQLIDPGRSISYGIVQPGTPFADGVPIIRVSDVRNGQIATVNPLRVRHDVEAQYLRTRLRGGELLITIVGTVGETAIVPQSLAGWNVARAIAVLPIRGDVSAYWVKLALQSPLVRSRIDSRLNTTVQATLNLGDVAKLPILLPPKADRERIEAIIGAFDDKIDINRRMNETLEAIARAIFKDWFVDFGPTLAKMEGRAPYLAPEIWALFPARLDNKGKPEGWRQGILLDLCELKRGYDLPTADRLMGPYPIVSSSGISGYHSASMAQGPGVVTGRYGTIGEVYFIDGAYWPLNTALYVRDFKNNSPRFVYYMLRDIDFLRFSDKAAVPGINRNHLHQAPVALPPPPAQQAFDCLLASGWALQQANDAEHMTLSTLRDLLLPRLMSGEIRVKDAEKVAEAVL